MAAYMIKTLSIESHQIGLVINHHNCLELNKIIAEININLDRIKQLQLCRGCPHELKPYLPTLASLVKAHMKCCKVWHFISVCSVCEDKYNLQELNPLLHKSAF